MRKIDDLNRDQIAEQVHIAFVEEQRAQGVTSRISDQTGEEQLADWADLSEEVKDLDRWVVNTVLDAVVALQKQTGTDELPSVEDVARKVQDNWMEGKRRNGVTTRTSQKSGQELMQPHDDLAEVDKEGNRVSVRTVYKALRDVNAA